MRLCLVRVERQLVPSRRLAALFIPSTPIVIKAGGNIGHMGFYPLPEESGKQSRYQVHIECLSMGDQLPTFLTNSDRRC